MFAELLLLLPPFLSPSSPPPPLPFTVSQFTLHAVYKGSKASFHRAMPGSESEDMFYGLAAELQKQYSPAAVKGKGQAAGSLLGLLVAQLGNLLRSTHRTACSCLLAGGRTPPRLDSLAQ